MSLELQYKIMSDIRQINFLKENSYWYKYLNRSTRYYKNFLDDMREKYKLKPSDKIDKIISDIEMINSFLEVLK